MAFTNTVSGSYTALQFRVDSNNKIWVQAHAAHGSLTISAPYPIRATISGYRTIAVSDTGFASTTAASHQNYFIGVPDEAIPSACIGWLQIGGERTSVNITTGTGTAGNTFRWSNGSIISRAAGSNDDGFVADFAVCTTSASATASHSMFLLARRVCGIT